MGILSFFARRRFRKIFKFNPEDGNRGKIQIVIDEFVADFENAVRVSEESMVNLRGKQTKIVDDLESMLKKKDVGKKEAEILMRAYDFIRESDRIMAEPIKKRKRLQEACETACSFGFVVSVPVWTKIKIQ